MPLYRIGEPIILHPRLIFASQAVIMSKLRNHRYEGENRCRALKINERRSNEKAQSLGQTNPLERSESAILM